MKQRAKWLQRHGPVSHKEGPSMRTIFVTKKKSTGAMKASLSTKLSPGNEWIVTPARGLAAVHTDVAPPWMA
jgi:hypothetical protein